MRGLVRGVWYRNTEIAPGWQAEIDMFNRAGYRGWVDVDRFRHEPQRYHLYISYACPFAHRVLLARTLLGLANILSMSVLHPYLGGPHGWFFADETYPDWCEGITLDHLYGAEFLYQLYYRSNPFYTGRVTVPVLWDRQTETIISTDSGDITRMLSKAFRQNNPTKDLCSPTLQDEVGRMNRLITQKINVGVYRVGMAQSQEDYNVAVVELFQSLAEVDTILDGRNFLVGEQLTEADCRLFTTAIRFDVAYYPVLYTNLKRWVDFPNLAAHTRRLLEIEEVRQTVQFSQYRRHYFDDDVFVNRKRLTDGCYIVPAGPLSPDEGGSVVELIAKSDKYC